MLKQLGSGLAGAVAVTLVHETARRVIPHGAPRMDVIGQRAIARPIRAAGGSPPQGRNLYRTAMAGDLLLNTLYYSLVGFGRAKRRGDTAVGRGGVLGLAAGLGAALLPPLIGLGNQPRRRTPWTQILTVLWYLIGGLVSAAATVAMNRRAR